LPDERGIGETQRYECPAGDTPIARRGRRQRDPQLQRHLDRVASHLSLRRQVRDLETRCERLRAADVLGIQQRLDPLPGNVHQRPKSSLLVAREQDARRLLHQ
jgi:hypothetical protein